MTIRVIAHGSPDYRAAVALRDSVLRFPLGLAFSEGELAAESASLHFAAFDDEGRLLGCLVLCREGDALFHMRQVAVAGSARKRGLGAALVDFAENHARAAGAALLYCHARETAVPFYEKLGYAKVGEPFEEVTIPHLRMEKRL